MTLHMEVEKEQMKAERKKKKWHNGTKDNPWQASPRRIYLSLHM